MYYESSDFGVFILYGQKVYLFKDEPKVCKPKIRINSKSKNGLDPRSQIEYLERN